MTGCPPGGSTLNLTESVGDHGDDWRHTSRELTLSRPFYGIYVERGVGCREEIESGGEAAAAGEEGELLAAFVYGWRQWSASWGRGGDGPCLGGGG